MEPELAPIVVVPAESVEPGLNLPIRIADRGDAGIRRTPVRRLRNVLRRRVGISSRSGELLCRSRSDGNRLRIDRDRQEFRRRNDHGRRAGDISGCGADIRGPLRDARRKSCIVDRHRRLIVGTPRRRRSQTCVVPSVNFQSR